MHNHTWSCSSLYPDLSYNMMVIQGNKCEITIIIFKSPTGCHAQVEVWIRERRTLYTEGIDKPASQPPHAPERGVVRHLYDRAQAVTLKEENLCDDKKYLESALQENGYPRQFIRRST